MATETTGAGTPMARPGEILVLVTPEQIKDGKFLLGRQEPETHALTAITVVNSRNHVPPSTNTVEYKLIGMGDDLPGQPLDELVDEYCQNWDAVTPINLYFNSANAAFIRFEPAGSTAARATG